LKNFFILIIAGMAGILFFSCSRGEPTIAFGFMELVYYLEGEEERKPVERYSFFVLPEDDDGIENLADLYLHHDREELRWYFSSGDWISLTDGDGKTWVGSRSVAMMDDEILPRGQYRAVLINKGGERAERKFTFDAPVDPRYPFPYLHIADGKYSIDSRYPVHHLIVYGEQGNILETQDLPGLEGSLQDLTISANGRNAALWAEDPEYHVSALTEAVSLR
jgi:hypothetical protein